MPHTYVRTYEHMCAHVSTCQDTLVCMGVHVYVRMHVCAWLCMGVQNCAFVCMCVHGCAGVCIGVHVCACVCMGVHVCAWFFMLLCMCVHVCACGCACVCMGVHWLEVVVHVVHVVLFSRGYVRTYVFCHNCQFGCDQFGYEPH